MWATLNQLFTQERGNCLAQGIVFCAILLRDWRGLVDKKPPKYKRPLALAELYYDLNGSVCGRETQRILV